MNNVWYAPGDGVSEAAVWLRCVACIKEDILTDIHIASCNFATVSFLYFDMVPTSQPRNRIWHFFLYFCLSEKTCPQGGALLGTCFQTTNFPSSSDAFSPIRKHTSGTKLCHLEILYLCVQACTVPFSFRPWASSVR